MGRNLKGKELGEGIYQQANGTYCARFIDRFGKRKSKRSKKLQEVRQWLADATYINEHSDIEQATNMMVDAWFEYWIDVKKKTVRPNTVRNYTERYNKNIQKIIGRKILTEVKPIHCQKIFTDMAEEGYKTSTIYQTRIALFNMLEFAKENEVILSNPCKKSVKSDMGKPSQKKEALTIDIQKKFIEYAKGQSYENQFRFILQTGLRTGSPLRLKKINSYHSSCIFFMFLFFSFCSVSILIVSSVNGIVRYPALLLGSPILHSPTLYRYSIER